jgi:hypothetical protein
MIISAKYRWRSRVLSLSRSSLSSSWGLPSASKRMRRKRK